MRRRALIGSLVWPYAAGVRAATITHPRLYLTGARVAELKRKIAGSHSGIWAIVKENADEHIGRMPTEKFDNESEMRTAGRGVVWQAFAFLLSAEQRYLDGAKAWMARICSYPRWENDKSL